MAFRVTGDEVKEIFETELTADQMTPFIRAANSYIAGVDLANRGLSASLLKEIELWLSAHWACARDPRLASETFGDATDKYIQPGNGSPYWEYAVQLDTSGTLARAGGKISVMVTAADVLP